LNFHIGLVAAEHLHIQPHQNRTLKQKLPVSSEDHSEQSTYKAGATRRAGQLGSQIPFAPSWLPHFLQHVPAELLKVSSYLWVLRSFSYLDRSIVMLRLPSFVPPRKDSDAFKNELDLGEVPEISVKDH
jgi:hypothetical protein